MKFIELKNKPLNNINAIPYILLDIFSSPNFLKLIFIKLINIFQYKDNIFINFKNEKLLLYFDNFLLWIV